MRREASFISVATAVGLIVSALSGGMFMGALASDVERLQEQQAVSEEDHDRLIKVEEKVEHIEDDLEEVKSDVKEILEAVRRIGDEDDG